MHWSEKIADTIIAKNPNKEEYVCAAGISPLGFNSHWKFQRYRYQPVCSQSS